MKKMIKNILLTLFMASAINCANAKCLVQMWGKWILVSGASCTDVYEHLEVSYCVDVDGVAHTVPTITQTSPTEALLTIRGIKYQLASDEIQRSVNKLFNESKANKKKCSIKELNKLKPIADKNRGISISTIKQIALELNAKQIILPPKS